MELMERVGTQAGPHDALHLWSKCIQPKLTFMARMVPPHLVSDIWDETTSRTWRTFSRLWRQAPPEGPPRGAGTCAGTSFPPTQVGRARADRLEKSSTGSAYDCLLASGGQPEVTGGAAGSFESGFTEFFQNVITAATPSEERDAEAMSQGSEFLAYMRSITKDIGQLYDIYMTGGRRAWLLQEGFETSAARNLKDREDTLRTQKDATFLQHVNHLANTVWPQLSPSGQEGLKHVATLHSAMFWTKPPTGEATCLEAEELAVAVNFRLGATGGHSVLRDNVVGALCPRWRAYIDDLEELNGHLATCPETAPIAGVGDSSLKSRHERVASRFRNFESLAGVEVRKEPCFPSQHEGSAARADWAASWRGTQRYLDVTSPMPSRQEQGALRRAENAKRLKYEHYLGPDERFVPMVISPYGAMGEDAQKEVRDIARYAAQWTVNSNTWGHVEEEGLTDHIQESHLAGIVAANVKDTARLLLKAIDAIVGDLQMPQGVLTPRLNWHPPSRLAESLFSCH